MTNSFLLAITIAGCLTISFGGLGYILLPSVKGSKLPTKNVGGLAVKRCKRGTCRSISMKLTIFRGRTSQIDPEISRSFQIVYRLGTLEHRLQ
jgi:hypothetical protein